MFKICVIGCGEMSVSGHGPSLLKYKNEYKDVLLAACCDLSKEKAIKYKEEFGFDSYYTDYNLMLSEIKPDVVCLISPVQLTCYLATEIIKLGYNIILEKPPGLNKDDITKMIKQAELSKVSVRTAFNRRYTPLVLKLKEMLKEKSERIYNVTYQMYRHGRTDSDFSTTAIHAIDVVKDIIGADYKYVRFTYQELPEWGDNTTNIYLDCGFKNGAVAQITIVPMGGVVMERISVNTENNTYLAELPFWKNLDSPGRLRHIKDKTLVADILGADLVDSTQMYEESGFYEENRSFFELLRANEEVTCDLKSAIQSVEIANCIRTRKDEYIA